MTRIIIADTSVLIDIQKGGLLIAMTKLKYDFVIPLLIWEDELQRFSPSEKAELKNAMEIFDLLPPLMVKLVNLQDTHTISRCDCACIIVAHDKGGDLLTGDKGLRKVAERQNIKVFGALWLVDEMYKHSVCPRRDLIDALNTWLDDATVGLLDDEIKSRLKRFQRK